MSRETHMSCNERNNILAFNEIYHTIKDQNINNLQKHLKCYTCVMICFADKVIVYFLRLV